MHTGHSMVLCRRSSPTQEGPDHKTEPRQERQQLLHDHSLHKVSDSHKYLQCTRRMQALVASGVSLPDVHNIERINTLNLNIYIYIYNIYESCN